MQVMINGELFTLSKEEETKRLKVIEDNKKESEKVKYINQRRLAYPNTQEQLDMIYWDKKNGTENWVQMIDKIKADNPKP